MPQRVLQILDQEISFTY